MLTTIQLFLLIFILFAITRVLLRLREKILTISAAFFWLLIWLGAAAIILLPATATKIAQIFGVGRGVDVILYISLALLFYLTFRGYVMIEDLRRDLTTVVRRTALQNLQDNSIPSERTPAFKPGMKRILSEEERTTAFRPWESISRRRKYLKRRKTAR